FAELGAVALENDRLLDRERRRVREAELLAELAALPVEPLAEFTARLAASTAPVLGAERFEIWIADPDGSLRPLGYAPSSPALATPPSPAGEASAGRPSAVGARHAERPAPDRPLAALYRDGDSLLCNDTREMPALLAELRSPALRSVLAVPLWIGDV